MNDDRRRILDMLAQGKVTAGEAERLIAALERSGTGATAMGGSDRVRYLRVLVDTNDPQEGPTKVNVRVPMQLLRAGVRLTGVIPASARKEVNNALRKEGIPFDINNLTPQNLDELVEQLRELTVNVDNENTKVRVFCE
jgi:hypothetical protein